jgi:uncharacterized MAPEG superfamily protein
MVFVVVVFVVVGECMPMAWTWIVVYYYIPCPILDDDTARAVVYYLRMAQVAFFFPHPT